MGLKHSMVQSPAQILLDRPRIRHHLTWKWGRDTAAYAASSSPTTVASAAASSSSSSCYSNPTAPADTQAQCNPYAMYKYYGAPAVAFWAGSLAGHDSNADEASQPVTCEVCNIQCSTLGDLRIHETGKKHKMNLEMLQKEACEVCKGQRNSQYSLRSHETCKHKKNLVKLQDSITPEPAKPPNDAVGASTIPAAAVPDGVMPAVQPKKNKSSAATQEDLEEKKRGVLEAGAAQGELRICSEDVVQLGTCEVCKILWGTTLAELRAHETGKKHKRNLKKLQDSINPLDSAVGASTAPTAAVADGVMTVVQPKKNKRSAATPEDLEEKKRRVLETGAAEGELQICTTCEVCKVQCTSLNDLRAHETGKKHKKNLEKLQDSITPEPVKPPNDAVGASTEPAAAAVADGVIPAVQPKRNKRSAGTPEDLEAKRRRVAADGIPEGELKICMMCNVVVSRQEDLESHISGHRHNTKLRKQQQVQPLPQVA